MALDANLLDDGGPDQDAVNAMRPKRKRIKPWEDPGNPPLVSSRDRASNGLKIKYGQEIDVNTDKCPEKYGRSRENADNKYGQNEDNAPQNTDTAPAKYGQLPKRVVESAVNSPVLKQSQSSLHETRETQAPKKMRTKAPVRISNENRPYFENALSANKRHELGDNTDKKSVFLPAVPNKQPSRPDFQIQTSFGDKYGQRVPPSPQKVALLELLKADQEATGLGHTRMLSTTCIAQELGLPLQSVRKQLDRMKAEGRIERINGRRGRGVGGCTYRVSPAEVQALQSGKYGQKIRTNTDKKYGQSASSDDSSSRSLNKASTKAQGVKALLERFDSLLERIQVPTQFNVDSTDVAGWWQKARINLEMADDALEDFEESFERWVFKLSSSKFPEGSNPKAVLASNVLRGLCGGKIPGFVSWREREAKALEELRRERLNGVRRRQLAEYAENFEIWFAEAEDDALWACVPEDSREAVKAPRGKKLQRGAILKSLVKGKYAEANDIDFEHWQHLAEQFT